MLGLQGSQQYTALGSGLQQQLPEPQYTLQGLIAQLSNQADVAQKLVERARAIADAFHGSVATPVNDHNAKGEPVSILALLQTHISRLDQALGILDGQISRITSVM